MDYYEIPSLSNFYLEDSFVLSIDEGVRSLTFELEAVLTESHSKYETPRSGEHYCYRRVSLRILNVDSIIWVDRKFVAFRDFSGASDYGNIDLFSVDDGFYRLSGDWGEVVVKGG